MEISLNFEDNVAKMKIDGAMTSENAHIFQEKLKEVLESDSKFLEVDFSTCRSISSSGIGKLLIFYKEYLAKDGEIEIVKSSPSIYELFMTIKLNQLFTINL